jgi:hypothetical protein
VLKIIVEDWGMVQMVDPLSRKCEALNSIQYCQKIKINIQIDLK